MQFCGMMFLPLVILCAFITQKLSKGNNKNFLTQSSWTFLEVTAHFTGVSDNDHNASHQSIMPTLHNTPVPRQTRRCGAVQSAQL